MHITHSGGQQIPMFLIPSWMAWQELVFEAAKKRPDFLRSLVLEKLHTASGLHPYTTVLNHLKPLGSQKYYIISLKNHETLMRGVYGILMDSAFGNRHTPGKQIPKIYEDDEDEQQ